MDQKVGETHLSAAPTGFVDLVSLRASAEAQLRSDSTFADIEVAIENAARDQGWSLADAPAADLSVTSVFRVDDGTSVSEVHALHEHAHGAAAKLAENIHNAVTRAISNLAGDVVASVTKLISEGKYIEASEEALGNEIAWGLAAEKLRNLFRAIDRSLASKEERIAILKPIIAAASMLHAFSEHQVEAEELLGLTDDERQRCHLRLFKANGFAESGLTEAATVVYEALVADPACPAIHRGWALHGMARLANGRDAVAQLHERAGDAFMEAGDLAHAANDYLIAAQELRHRSAARALDLCKRVLTLFPGTGPLNAEQRASLLHSQAELLSARGDEVGALESALEAVRLRSPLTGNDEAKASSMYLAAQLAEALSQSDRAKELLDGADKIASNFTGHAATRHRFVAASEAGDLTSIGTIRMEAAANGDVQLEALCEITAAIESQGSFEERIATADRARLRIEQANLSDRDKALVAHTFAELYRAHGDDQHALTWYLRLLDVSPEHELGARQAIRLLYRYERWVEAVHVLETQISLRGERPDLLLALGTALISSGRPHEALDRALRAQELALSDKDKQRAIELVKQANAAAKVVPAPSPVASRRAVTLHELEETLRQFKHHVESDRRMEFWSRAKKGNAVPPPGVDAPPSGESEEHTWRSHPEATAKTILWSYLAGQLPGVEILHEVPAGPGRIDLYVRFEGGERVVVELKMLGGGRYSTTYAEEGVDQLCEYMKARHSHVGYLIAFDARSRDQGKPLERAAEAVGRTIYVLHVDVQPTVNKLPRPPKAKRARKPRVPPTKG